MLFEIQQDLGFAISAYVVPDSGGKTPSLRLLNRGVEILTVAADQSIPALVAAGRHATGKCGFAIDETLVPGLSAMPELELVEAESGLLIYRRSPANAIEGIRMFRLETHLLPLWRLDDVLKPRFQLWYKGIERFGLETSTQVFCLKNNKSTYVSGRLHYKSFEFYLKQGIDVISILRDPYDELAERLLILKNVGTRADMILGTRDAIRLAPVIDLLGDFNDFSQESCKTLFKKASKAIFDALSNPLVRQLTMFTPNELPRKSAVAPALDVLASFKLVGLRSHAPEFSGALSEILEVEEELLPSLAEHERITEFSRHLRAIPAVESLIEQDLELFHVVQSAFKTVAFPR
jgi:hypothetical protein